MQNETITITASDIYTLGVNKILTTILPDVEITVRFVGWLVGISTLVGYLMSNPVYTLNIYH